MKFLLIICITLCVIASIQADNASEASKSLTPNNQTAKSDRNMIRLGPIMDEVVKFIVSAAFQTAYGILSKETIAFLIHALNAFASEAIKA